LAGWGPAIKTQADSGAPAKYFEVVHCLKGGVICGRYSLSQSLWLKGFSPGVCQITIKKSETRPRGPADPVQIHQLFFERVSHSNPRTPFTFQSDLTDAEMAILNSVAAHCDSKLQPLNDRAVVLEARMRFVESGDYTIDVRGIAAGGT
jgi:hypothetical protein